MNTIWQERWDALDTQLQSMAKQYASATDSVSSCLQALSESLRAFGQDQFSFFWKGFNTGQLLPAMMIPPEHILRATLDQVAFDINIIQRIFDQRQQPALAKVLAQADKMAQSALDVAIQGGLLPQCGILTYFNKSPNVRIIPYAPLALIGVPYTATTTPLDLLAIPHEVGHYVYHHAPGLAAQLHARIPLYPDWVNHWTEEIFADVYGALVAGPVIGESFQSILLDNPQEKFVADDGEHPPDAIRPYGYTHALRQLGYTTAADALEQTWTKELAKRHNPTVFMPHQSNAPAALSEARRLIEQTTEIFVAYLLDERQVKQPEPWSDDNGDIAKIQAAFATRLKQPMKNAHYLLTAVADKIGVTANSSQPENLRDKGSTQTWRDWVKAKARQNPDVLLPAQAWLPVFTAGHWPVKGPEGNSDGGV